MESPNNTQPNRPASVLQRVWGGLKAYLTD